MRVVGRSSSVGPKIVTILISVTLAPLAGCSMNQTFVLIGEAFPLLVVVIAVIVIPIGVRS